MSAVQPPREMNTSRLEGFSDGVLAVVITIMVLSLRPPAGDSLNDLKTLTPGLLIYVLSFTTIGIYWGNHHNLLRATRRISGSVMWANLHLLFWLSLVPFGTAWVGAHPRATWPAIIYGVLGLFAAVAYTILVLNIRAINQDTHMGDALKWDTKSMASFALIVLGIGLAFIEPLLAYGAYTLVALAWFIPDRRLVASAGKQEQDLANEGSPS
jgi:uncharacterized membrane protein